MAKRKLIFTLGEGNPIRTFLLRTAIDFYDGLPEELFTIAQGEAVRPPEEILTQWSQSYIKKLVSPVGSPISFIVNKLKGKEQRIWDYLQDIYGDIIAIY